MDFTPFREFLIGKVPVQHLLFYICNFLEAHHAKVLDHKLLDIEVTQELVRLNVGHNIRGGHEAPICFFSEYKNEFLVGDIIFCLFYSRF